MRHPEHIEKGNKMSTKYESSTPVERRLPPVLPRSMSPRPNRWGRGWLKSPISMIFMLLIGLLVSGCGMQQELETAKQNVDRLTAENKKFSEIIADLTQAKNSLTGEVAALEGKNSNLTEEIARIQKAEQGLSRENSELKRKQNDCRNELTNLQKDKLSLNDQLEQLKKQVQPDGRTSMDDSGGQQPLEASRQSPKPREALTPCDSVLEFMRKTEEIVRRVKGEQRTKQLKDLKQEYATRLNAAPEKARKASFDWVAELERSWDKPDDNTVFNLLSKRNAVLETCEKSPSALGF
jgi:hypothetical protein